MQPQRKIIEWPEHGSAKRWPIGGWWVVNEREGRGYTPLAGPYKTRSEAEAAAVIEVNTPCTEEGRHA